MKWLALLGAVMALGPLPLQAQHARFRLEAQGQSVAFRGTALDSVPLAATILGPGGGRTTADGFAVRCEAGLARCYYFRPGPSVVARPLVLSAAGTAWGFGVRGLSVRVHSRVAMDLAGDAAWPGTQPAVQLLEGYAEYAIPRVTGRLGRQTYASRLGFTGFDGGRVSGRFAGQRLEADGYLGWGLGRATALPVSSEALNPLDDYQPRQRQLVAGAALGWHAAFGSLRVDYQREVDTRSRYFVAERAAASALLRGPYRLRLELGGTYDLALAAWGSADAVVRYAADAVNASVGYQRYRPHFDLWTIWGAFSPTGYQAVNGSVAWRADSKLSLQARASRFWFEDTETETPLVSVVDRGWRIHVGAGYRPVERLAVQLDHETEFGPGASFSSVTGSARFQAAAGLSLGVTGGRLNRPLEFRVDEATLHLLGVEVEWRPSERWEGSVGLARYMETRKRPDAAGLDWNQTRLTARLAFLLGGDSGPTPLPRLGRSRVP